MPPLDVDVVETAKDVLQDPGKSTLGMMLSIAGSIYGTAKIVRWFEERRTAKAWKKIGPVAPKEQEGADAAAARELLDQRAWEAQRDSALARETWRRQDAEAKLAEAIREQIALRNALTRARAVREEQQRMLAGLRADNAALRADLGRVRAELDTYHHVGELELEPVTEERAGELPTPMRPPPTAKRTTPR